MRLMWYGRLSMRPGNVLRQAVAWILVPVAVFSGQPTMACRCAGGRIKLFCPRSLERSLIVGQQATAKGYAVPCCCARPHAANLDAVCCTCGGASVVSCCPGRDCCCTPLLRALFTAPESAVPNLYAPWAPWEAGGAVSRPVWEPAGAAPRYGTLPPPDLIILHCVLRI